MSHDDGWHHLLDGRDDDASATDGWHRRLMILLFFFSFFSILVRAHAGILPDAYSRVLSRPVASGVKSSPPHRVLVLFLLRRCAMGGLAMGASCLVGRRPWSCSTVHGQGIRPTSQPFSVGVGRLRYSRFFFSIEILCDLACFLEFMGEYS